MKVCQVDDNDGMSKPVATQDGVKYVTVGTDIVISYTGGSDGKYAIVYDHP